ITTSYDGSPIAGQGTLFPEYNEGNGKREKPKALAVVLDHVKDEDGDGAANVTDVELFLKRNRAARIALKASEKYPGGDFRSWIHQNRRSIFEYETDGSVYSVGDVDAAATRFEGYACSG